MSEERRKTLADSFRRVASPDVVKAVLESYAGLAMMNDALTRGEGRLVLTDSDQGNPVKAERT